MERALGWPDIVLLTVRIWDPWLRRCLLDSCPLETSGLAATKAPGHQALIQGLPELTVCTYKTAAKGSLSPSMGQRAAGWEDKVTGPGSFRESVAKLGITTPLFQGFTGAFQAWRDMGLLGTIGSGCSNKTPQGRAVRDPGGLGAATERGGEGGCRSEGKKPLTTQIWGATSQAVDDGIGELWPHRTGRAGGCRTGQGHRGWEPTARTPRTQETWD